VTAPIRAPFFEIGPKTFLGRSALLEIAEAAAAASVRHGVAVMITPPALDLEAVKRAAPGLWVFAQAMDVDAPGMSTGAVLPEALAAVGADGVMLDHAERPLPAGALPAAIARAAECGLLTLVCADGVERALSCAAHRPDLILLEPHELIGTAGRRERPWIGEADEAIARVAPGTLVMHSGGVGDEDTTRAIIAQGAAGTGATTAIVQARDPAAMAARMIAAVRDGWDARGADVAREG
jgi:triosephosphate isomerase (TIM)